MISVRWLSSPARPEDRRFGGGGSGGGLRWENQQSDACVDWYFRAAIQAWRCLESATCPSETDPEYRAAWRVYQQSLARLIPTASRFRRLDARSCLVINDGGVRRSVPVKHHGFTWQPAGLLSSDSPQPSLKTPNCSITTGCRGLGVALVGVRHACGPEQFFRSEQPFPVTAVLRSGDKGPTLDFYNPCVVDSTQLGTAMIRLEWDLSAPYAYFRGEKSLLYIEGFLDPADNDVKAQLFMTEPYQRGKIPVVLIHGLLSDPTTWVDVVNELKAHRDLYQQYQVWYFDIPQGGPILDSAATLREQLLAARDQSDPKHDDPALARMVLIGHSMGGLVAKLQATYSYDILWRHVARQPLAAVRAPPGDARGGWSGISILILRRWSAASCSSARRTTGRRWLAAWSVESRRTWSTRSACRSPTTSD